MENKSKDNWQRVRSIFEDALLRPAGERRDYAKALCGDDEPLWTEVNSLLDSHESSEAFLETSAVVQVVENLQAHGNQLAAGQRLLHYEILNLIGAGGMGEVYLALDTRLGRNVAVKLLRRDLLPHFRAGDRLLREARAAALLEHANICQIHEISEVDGFSFIVMQYVAGTTLDEILSGSGVDAPTALDIACQVAEGLAEAHRQGIIHRDIKPANIIVSNKGHVKILDFGLAKFIEAETGADAVSRLESTGGVMGTVPYMSPEQLLGEPVDARTDIFSFGAMLYEMLAGVSAFGREKNDETISAVLREDLDWELISSALQPVVRRCLAKDKADRYASAGELANALAKVRTNGPITRLARSKPTGRVRVDAATDAVDVETRPLYAWQSDGRDLRGAEEDSGPPISKTRWINTRRLGVVGLLAVLLAGSVYGGYIIYQTYHSGSATESVQVQANCSNGWDLGLDFSESANPNGPWSYNAGDMPIQTFWQDFGWAYAAPPKFRHIPFWTNARDIGFDVVRTHSSDHASGLGYDLANVTWTSPITGDVNLDLATWLDKVDDPNHQARSNTWKLYHGDALLASGVLVENDGFDGANPATYTGTRSVATGDVIRLETVQHDSSPYGTHQNFRFRLCPIGTPAPPPTACSTVYNAAEDFSITINDIDRIWQYGFTEPDGTRFKPYTQTRNGCQTRVEEWFSCCDAAIGHSTVDHSFSCGSCDVNEPGFLNLHGNATGNKSALRWKAPTAGTFLIQGEFRDHHMSTVDISIIKNENVGQPLFSDSINDDTCAATSVHKPFSITVAVSAGDTIDLLVGTGNGHNFADSTGLSATIISVCSTPTR